VALNSYDANVLFNSVSVALYCGTAVGGLDWNVCTSFNISSYVANKFAAVAIDLTPCKSTDNFIL
jgi:hypothetical protein